MSEPSPSMPRGALLRRSDQAAVAVLVAIALTAMTAWWLLSGACVRRIEVERAVPQTAQFVVDINTAEEPELTQLPGIGSTLAQRIITTRETSGPFSRPEDLRRVRGIGEKKMAQLRPYVQTGGVGEAGR